MQIKLIYPLGVLAVALGLATMVVFSASEIKTTATAAVAVSVRVVTVQPQRLQMFVHSQGSVQPRQETALKPEVSGTVLWLSPELVAGGKFAKGDLLVRIDDSDYQRQQQKASAAVSRSQGEKKLADFEFKRIKTLRKSNLASQSQLEKAQRDAVVSDAAYQQALADLAQANADMARTQVLAPYAGSVRNKSIATGQFVNRGEVIASVFATDYFEIQLPVSTEKLAYVTPQATTKDHPFKIELHAIYAGQAQRWQAVLARTEAEISRTSRMQNIIARLDSKMSQHSAPVVGLFVQAKIDGIFVDNLVDLPRSALRQNSTVLVVGEDSRLNYRKVQVYRRYQDRVYLSAGLRAGERVCLSNLQSVVDNMLVTPVAI